MRLTEINDWLLPQAGKLGFLPAWGGHKAPLNNPNISRKILIFALQIMMY
jgi:hypothetical protein